MNFAIVFLVFAATMFTAWQGDRRWALVLFPVGLVLTFALYLHHATSVLPLSF